MLFTQWFQKYILATSCATGTLLSAVGTEVMSRLGSMDQWERESSRAVRTCHVPSAETEGSGKSWAHSPGSSSPGRIKLGLQVGPSVGTEHRQALRSERTLRARLFQKPGPSASTGTGDCCPASTPPPSLLATCLPQPCALHGSLVLDSKSCSGISLNCNRLGPLVFGTVLT